MSQFNDWNDKEYFECDCEDVEHILRASFEKDDTEMMYLYVRPLHKLIGRGQR